MALSNLFSVDFHNSLKKRVENSYHELVQDLRQDMAGGFKTAHLTDAFQASFKDIIQRPSLDKFSPLSFYWGNLLENLIYIVQLHEEGEEAEEEIFDFWNDGEYAASFHGLLKDQETVMTASESLRVLLENQVLAFYYLHIETEPEGLEEPLVYRVIPEIGDHAERIYLTDQHHIVDMDQTSDLFPSLALTNISEDRTQLEVEIKQAYPVFQIQGAVQEISPGLSLLPQSKEAQTRAPQFVSDILKALEIIKQGSPECLTVFSSFTHSLVPVNEPGVVSYSMQSLPGYSCLNMFERDFIDLLDDLVHENGHHFLNTFLNHTELINEDDEKIYYSPWRRALRPIRGIYHAVFTFYWALKLFTDLSNRLELFSDDSQKQKVLLRAIEEFHMLRYCEKDLAHAYENGKICPGGQDLIQEVFQSVHSLESKISSFEGQLNSENKEKIRELVEHLNEKRLHYQL